VGPFKEMYLYESHLRTTSLTFYICCFERAAETSNQMFVAGNSDYGMMQLYIAENNWSEVSGLGSGSAITADSLHVLLPTKMSRIVNKYNQGGGRNRNLKQRLHWHR
jgi:hypothetical protein